MKSSAEKKSFVYSVFNLNSLAKRVLEENLPAVWVEGEISNFTQPRSGHYYFSLKDAKAQLRCVMFLSKQTRLDFRPEDGMQVLLYGQLTLYPGRGAFQLIVDCMEEAGHGALQRAFEALKKKLYLAGLFDEKYKKPLPALPKRIGIITSPTGAAVRDVLAVLKQRAPMVETIIYPSLVQGERAAAELVRALALANARRECEVLLLVRGGGSLEDLWPFNEEALAQAIFNSEIPIISGVGHEIDFTIADFVSDYRAETPSMAAECVVPHKDSINLRLGTLKSQLSGFMKQQLKEYETNLIYLHRQLKHPLERLQVVSERLDYAQQRLDHIVMRNQNRFQDRLLMLAKLFETLNPYQVLARGYAIVTTVLNGKPVIDSSAVNVGELVKIKLGQGQLICEITKCHDEKKNHIK